MFIWINTFVTEVFVEVECMADASNVIAEKMFEEINENIRLAEECWKSKDIKFEIYFRNAKEKLEEFESLFEH